MLVGRGDSWPAKKLPKNPTTRKNIIAGAVEVFSVAWAGQKPWGEVFIHYMIPTLIGNTLGGVTLVAALNPAQVVAGGEGEDV